MSSVKLKGGATEKILSPAEQQAKIVEVRKLIGPIADKFPALFSDASILRFLKARNWNTKKTVKMMKATLKWRLDFKPEKIRWEDVAREAEAGKLYRANYLDKQGRTVLVMRPAASNSNSGTGQIKYLVYCMENAILNLNSNQEQMVWLVDFTGWNSSCVSLKVSRETANILQNHYPERLGLAILYNPPKVFESFWTMVKPFLEPKTFRKARFVYPDNPKSRMIMDELFDLNDLEPFFGGRNALGFNYKVYAEKMKEDDKKMSDLIFSSCSSPSYLQSVLSESQNLESENGSDEESSGDEAVCANSEEGDESIQDNSPCSHKKGEVDGQKDA
ncbi:hypothetical protein L6164_009240 [Bauhinia variegata]|uniref:Uncharacterized protein n=1 Tax=Bauhinia variegata TaxID=167791 RepID=A0ACB9PKE0_BAUVA|nr:hypothetical protein L6164_009240 [Bauhinia variegata]